MASLASDDRPDPKFKVGDKVIYLDNTTQTFEVTRIRWEVLMNVGKWQYELDNEDIGYAWEDDLRIAPKYMVGAKVLLGPDFDTGDTKVILEKNYVSGNYVNGERSGDFYMYKIRSVDNPNFVGYWVRENELRIAPKYMVGAKVVSAPEFDTGDTFVVLEEKYYDGILGKWYEYKIRGPRGQDTYDHWERESLLRIAPKYMVGEKVLSAPRFDTNDQFVIVAKNYVNRDSEESYTYKIRAVDNPYLEGHWMREDDLRSTGQRVPYSYMSEENSRPALSEDERPMSPPKYDAGNRVIYDNRTFTVLEGDIWNRSGEWYYRIQNSSSTLTVRESDLVLESELRPARKFNRGDKVIQHDRNDNTNFVYFANPSFTLEVTDDFFWDTDRNEWMYRLLAQDDRVFRISERDLIHVPKYKVGDKVRFRDVRLPITFEVTKIFWWSQESSWRYELRDEENNNHDLHFQYELRRALPDELENFEENRNKRKRDSSEEVPQEKKKYLKEPLTTESMCGICLEALLGPYNKLIDGKVINVGLDREILEQRDGQIVEVGIQNPDEVVIMYCCGNGFHKRCIDKQLEPTKVDINLGWGTYQDDILRKCPACNVDLGDKLKSGRPVYRHAEMVQSANETVEVETVTAIRLCALKKLKF